MVIEIGSHPRSWGTRLISEEWPPWNCSTAVETAESIFIRWQESLVIASPAQALPQAREGICDALAKEGDTGSSRDEQRSQNLRQQANGIRISVSVGWNRD